MTNTEQDGNFLGFELLRYKTNQKWISWDYETCNLATMVACNRPTQLGYTIYEGKKLIKTVEDWIWFPEVEEMMSKDAAAITRFDWNYYKENAIDPKEALEKFEQYALDEDYNLISANGWRFDIFLWSIHRQLCGKKIDWSHLGRQIDVQILAKALHLQVAPPKMRTDEWLSFNFKLADWHKRGVKTSLKHLTLSLDLPYDADRHHAESSFDTILAKNILDKQLFMLEI